MGLSQTVKVPENRRVQLDLEVPREIPTGSTARFNVIWFPQEEITSEKSPEKTDKPFIGEDGKIHFTRKQWDEMMNNSPGLQKLSGILHTDMTIDEIRMERLAKHL